MSKPISDYTADELSAKIEAIKAERERTANAATHGYCCDFTLKGQKYYADVSHVMLCGPECMIFAYDKDGKIDWSGVYCNRDVDISKEALLQCIKEFMEQED